MQDAMRAISPEYDKACDDFESELSDFIMGSNELKAPDYDPRSVSFNLLDRLKAAHAQQLPEGVEWDALVIKAAGYANLFLELSETDVVEFGRELRNLIAAAQE